MAQGGIQKTMKLDQELSLKNHWNRKYFWKPQEYADEKEWRLIVTFLHSFRILNKTLKIKEPQEFFQLRKTY